MFSSLFLTLHHLRHFSQFLYNFPLFPIPIILHLFFSSYITTFLSSLQLSSISHSYYITLVFSSYITSVLFSVQLLSISHFCSPLRHPRPTSSLLPCAAWRARARAGNTFTCIKTFSINSKYGTLFLDPFYPVHLPKLNTPLQRIRREVPVNSFSNIYTHFSHARTPVSKFSTVFAPANTCPFTGVYPSRFFFSGRFISCINLTIYLIPFSLRNFFIYFFVIILTFWKLM